jgi:hypothetical protein
MKTVNGIDLLAGNIFFRAAVDRKYLSYSEEKFIPECNVTLPT